MIAQTLNDGHHVKSYGGLSKADTRYPISAFITHLVYLKGTAVPVDIQQITVRFLYLLLEDSQLTVRAQGLGVRCIAVEGPVDERTKVPRFDAASVQSAIREILDSVSED